MIEATLHVLWRITPAMWSVGMVECLKRYLMVQVGALRRTVLPMCVHTHMHLAHASGSQSLCARVCCCWILS